MKLKTCTCGQDITEENSKNNGYDADFTKGHMYTCLSPGCGTTVIVYKLDRSKLFDTITRLEAFIASKPRNERTQLYEFMDALIMEYRQL